MNLREKVGEIEETIAYTMAYAPDRFPNLEFLPLDGQWNLDRIFMKLREQFEEIAKIHGESAPIPECRAAIEQSCKSYQEGDSTAGLLRIQEVYHAFLEM